MKYQWLDEYLLNKRGVTKDLQKAYYINLKLEPAEGEFLRSQYEDIVPGYYSNKQHWNSVKPDGAVPDELLKDFLDKSYHLVLDSFPKKQRREILGLSCCGTDCSECNFFEKPCPGCNAAGGKVFHMPEGEVCRIYACAVKKNKYFDCAGCGQLPCNIWKETRDPSMSQEEFEENIKMRVENLRY